MSDGLKLRVEEAEDIGILSAALEGIITSRGEMKYHADQRSFEITGSRFMHEKAHAEPQADGPFYRIRSGLNLADVQSIRSRNLAQDRPTDVQELLNIEVTAKDDGAAVITLNFAANRSIELAVECVNASLTDFGEVWETDRMPKHDLDVDNPDQAI